MRLMISVRSAAEARRALDGGAVLLDVKNPEEGSLGAQFPWVLREIKSVSTGNIEVSAAIGDMPNLPGTAALAALGAATIGVHYIKVGVFGPHTEPEAVNLVRGVCEAVHSFNSSVIVAGYADHQRVGTLPPVCFPAIAAQAGAQGCLIDTAVKDGHTLMDFLKREELIRLAIRAHESGLLFGVAGALKEEHLSILQDSPIDIAGLRTAVCREGLRNSHIDQSRVRDLIQKFQPIAG